MPRRISWACSTWLALFLAACDNSPGSTSDAQPDDGPRIDADAVANGPADAPADGFVDAPADGPSEGSTADARLPSPTPLRVRAGTKAGEVLVDFDAPTGATSFEVVTEPGGLTASATSAPITLSGLSAGTSYRFHLTIKSGATSSAPISTHRLSFYDVVETFEEPMTTPNDTIFTGTFTFDEDDKQVLFARGTLTQSMSKVDGKFGPPMTTVPLVYQLSSVAKEAGGVSGVLVATFAVDNTNTFTGGGFAPGGTQYYGLLEGTPNNQNAYALFFVPLSDPTATLPQAALDLLAYADCTPLGLMMGKTCMTGTTVAGYGRLGTMKGYPVSQTIQKR